MRLTKEVVKEYLGRPCNLLVYQKLQEKSTYKTFQTLIENGIKVDLEKLEDIDESSYNDSLYELVRENPEVFQKVIDEYEEELSDLQLLILRFTNFQEISEYSMRLFSSKYPNQIKRADTIDGSLDGVLLTTPQDIAKNTDELLKDNQIKVILEGQVIVDNLFARWDIMVKNESSLTMYEVKGSNSIYKNKKNETNIKEEFLHDVLFQYYVYKDALLKKGFSIEQVCILHLNPEFELNEKYNYQVYPLDDQYLSSYFSLPSFNINVSLKKEIVQVPLIQVLEENLELMKKTIECINDISVLEIPPSPNMKYHCKKSGGCLFLDNCSQRCGYPKEDSIFKLTNWNLVGGSYSKTKKLIEEYYIKSLKDISPQQIDEMFPDFVEYDGIRKYKNARKQIECSRNPEKFTYLEGIKWLLEKEYQVYPLCFFDFETFSYPSPLVYQSRPWEQICSQYSMHIVQKNYDIKNHQYSLGCGGGITHYEFIGNPLDDLERNPELSLIETFKNQLEKENVNWEKGQFTLIAYNKNFEMGRFQNMAKKYPQYFEFLTICKNRTVDLLDFFSFGFIYWPEFHGRASLKVISPSFKNTPMITDRYVNSNYDFFMTLNYKSEDNIIKNGSEALEAYQTLIRVALSSHLSEEMAKNTIHGLTHYCKKDSWGTVIIYDVVKAISEGKLKF